MRGMLTCSSALLPLLRILVLFASLSSFLETVRRCNQLTIDLLCRFKKEMWDKIARDMQLPWRAAEAMHWQIGEVEMAQRANVPVFHLAGGQPSVGGASSAGPGDSRPSSTSPASTTGPPPLPTSYSHTHNHSLPQIPAPHPPHAAGSPGPLRQRRSSGDSSPLGFGPRNRADSARSVLLSTPSGRQPALPPLHEIPASSTRRYDLPPVVTSAEATRR